jgi:MFS transporter, DHA3 family, multidrug efflux protein
MAFYAVLANSLVAATTNSFVWFAITFWVYLQTQSVLVMSVMSGLYLSTVAISGFLLGSIVDRYPKKIAMTISSLCSLGCYLVAAPIYLSAPPAAFSDARSIPLWIVIVLTLVGAIAGNLRTISLATLVPILVPEPERARANGLVGTTNGVAFLAASIFSGLAVGFIGIFWVLIGAIVSILVAIVHLQTISIPERQVADDRAPQQIDVRGTIAAVRLVPGLFALIFFTTFNNFLGGVFMALMDAYGLSLVSVQVWGILWGFLSLGFIVGGIFVARWGLGKNPLRSLFMANIVMWTIATLFTIQPSLILLTIGLFLYLCLIPIAEAAEQTILQQMIPPERLGRVIGFAQSVEQAASPLTAFAIGPIAQFIFIPLMTTGAGVDAIGWWFGTGRDRGIALLFTVTGAIGLIATLSAMRSRSYRLLGRNYPKDRL